MVALANMHLVCSYLRCSGVALQIPIIDLCVGGFPDLGGGGSGAVYWRLEHSHHHAGGAVADGRGSG